MKIRGLGVATLVAAFAAASVPTVVVSTVAVAASQECGFTHENGKLVFLGTCAGESSGDSQQPGGAPSSGCGDSKAPAYRMELATPC